MVSHAINPFQGSCQSRLRVRQAAHRAAAIRIDHSEDGLFVLKTALHLLVVDELAEAVEVHLAAYINDPSQHATRNKIRTKTPNIPRLPIDKISNTPTSLNNNSQKRIINLKNIQKKRESDADGAMVQGLA